MDLRYYLSIFLRRLHWFVLVAGVVSGLAFLVALSLPPAYVSSVKLLVEDAQIPDNMGGGMMRVPAGQQLQLLQTSLLTRTNLIGIANRVKPFPKQEAMTPDQIVGAMRDATNIGVTGKTVPMMDLTFTAPTGQAAAAVVNGYLDILLANDQESRTGRAGQTQEFFQQEVERLGRSLDDQSSKIVQFKEQNAETLPDSLDFRRSQQATLQQQVTQNEREIGLLQDQRERMVKVFETTGQVEGVSPTGANLTPQQAELATLQKQLSDARLVYSDSNPRVQLLQRRITQLQQAVSNDPAAQTQGGAPPSLLDVQLAEIDSRVAALREQRSQIQTQLDNLGESIRQTASNAIILQALERDYSNIQSQYNQATANLATASTGERIELLSRGQRVTVVEQPSVPNAPTKPNRMMIAGGGTAAGIVAGLALIIGLEFLHGTARRPSDVIRKLGVTPLVTIPYIRTPGEISRRKGLRVALLLIAMIALPAAVLAVHTFYQPLDLIADRLMTRFGLRS